MYLIVLLNRLAFMILVLINFIFIIKEKEVGH